MKLKFKKTMIVITAMITISIAANAQKKGDIAVGGYLAVGTGYDYTNGGIGAKFLYNVSNRIRLVAEIDSWREIVESNTSVYNINMYAHFLGSRGDRKTVIYPFVGIGRESKKFYDPVRTMHSVSPILFGGGIDFKLSSKLTLNGELRSHQLQFGGPWILCGGSFNLAVGLTYKIN